MLASLLLGDDQVQPHPRTPTNIQHPRTPANMLLRCPWRDPVCSHQISLIESECAAARRMCRGRLVGLGAYTICIHIYTARYMVRTVPKYRTRTPTRGLVGAWGGGSEGET